MINKELIKPEISELIKKQKWTDLRESVEDWPIPEISDLMNNLEKQDRVVFFRILPRELSAAVFAEFEPEQQNALLLEMTDDETRHLLSNLAPDDRTALLDELPGQVTQQLLNLLSPQDLKEARYLLGYPEESVGRLMTPDYLAVRPHWTIGQALDHIRKMGRQSETINMIYVTDPGWKLLDALELQLFILSDPDKKVEDIMDDTFVAVSAFDDREEAVQVVQKYDKTVLPVVDSVGILLGIVTIDDLLDVAEEEATEDFHKGAAVAPLRTSYREATVWSLFSKRILWLIILVFVNLVSSGVIEAFEEVLASALALAFFIPLLIDSGGNAGAQSATLMVRAIAIGDIQLSQWLRTISKELFVGISLGIAMGLASWLLGWYRGGMEIGMVVGLSMVLIVLVANIIGTLLPFILTRVRIDPAMASSPLITTIVDAAGLLIYFSIASVVLGVTLS
ncbi:magnesium transporter [Balneolaceae bacterium ANBcel3]|nr:magnesium transporter [Balneolaceae bacterium ANBcel3]